ncbi:MAG: rRNA maturation RNase YbeY [Gammaproteobacteria bacterium]|nr:rRNA maturation RNase YbeY [Gammaproteobacteria bacterium]MDD9897104.1 rRNA maturation RNase YbeY [Gammaproteobacteria bacterium]
MNVTVEFCNDCDSDWAPSLEDCEQWIGAALDGVVADANYAVSLRLVNSEESSLLNKNYREKSRPTNVLSFPANFPAELGENLEFLPLGDIVVCPEIVSKEAKDQGKALEAHWAHMLIHGALHLSGFDHSIDSEAELMESHEVSTLEKLGFPNPYLIG